MAEVNPVEIVIELIDSVSDDLAQIQAELDAIDAQSLDIDVDINATEEISSTEAQLDVMARDRTVDVDVDREGIPFGVGSGANRFTPTFNELESVAARTPPMAMRGIPVQGGPTAASAITGPDLDTDFGFRGDVVPGADEFAEMADDLPRLGRAIDRVRPRMSDLWNIAAALIPVWISMGAAVAGLAGSLVAVAGAGASIIGLGLIGWGQDVGQSLDIAAQKAQKLAQRVGNVFRPAGVTFAPILEDWMQGAPGQLQQLVGPMQELVVFEDTLSQIGSGFIDWVERGIRVSARFEDTISQLVLRFGRLTGGFIISFFRDMALFTSRNQQLLVRLADSLGEVFGALLDVSIVAVQALSTLSPVLDIVGFLAELLNTRLGRGLVTAYTLMLSLSSLAARLVPQLISVAVGIWEIYTATNSLNAALSTLRSILSTLGIGLVMAGIGLAANEVLVADNPGPSGTGGGGSGGPGGTYINIEGDVREREMDRLRDVSGGAAKTEIDFNESM